MVRNQLATISRHDRRFFTRNPGREVCIRRAFPFERQNHERYSLLVVKRTPHIRERVLFEYDGPLELLNDDVSCLAFMEQNNPKLLAGFMDIDFK